MQASRIGDLYLIECEELDEAQVAENDKISLWHERCGHINKQYIIDTAKAAEGLSELDHLKIDKTRGYNIVDCPPCVKGKLSKATLPRRS